ncbi:hypothetical protein BASA83_012496 [Batrachochytrium salamandrivorans]|nr:hypothetical protein BASA83_012496 [Batrachochytrium salamandrivorans]
MIVMLVALSSHQPHLTKERSYYLTSKRFTMWANYDSKKANYGAAADPFPTIKNLRKNIETITDEDLQLGLTDAFTMIRDHHTRWINVAPYSFYSTIGGFSKIQAGDQLLAVNGLSFVDWFEQNQFKSGGGANEFGGQRSALRFLSTRYGETNRLPSEDSITFKFKSRTNPQNSYTVKIPYVSGHDDECWGFGSNLYKNLTGITLPGTPPMTWPFSAEHLETITSPMLPTFFQGYGTRRLEKPEREAAVDRIFPKQKSTVTMNPTNVTKITWEWSEQAAFVSEPFEIEKPLGKFSLDVETAGIDVFTVLQNDGKTVVAQQRVAKKHKFSLPVSAVATTLGNSQITILGKAVGKQVLKTIRSVRSIPTDDDT